MPKNEIHKGDIGTVFEFTIKDGTNVVDLSAATMEIYLRFASGSVITRTCVLLTDGTDGKMKYTTVSGDLSESGDLAIQGKITIGTGVWKTDIQNVRVFENLA